jgi:hypothetical protein
VKASASKFNNRFRETKWFLLNFRNWPYAARIMIGDHVVFTRSLGCTAPRQHICPGAYIFAVTVAVIHVKPQ